MSTMEPELSVRPGAKFETMELSNNAHSYYLHSYGIYFHAMVLDSCRLYQECTPDSTALLTLPIDSRTYLIDSQRMIRVLLGGQEMIE